MQIELSEPLIADIVFNGTTYQFDILELHSLIARGQDRFTNIGVTQYDFLKEKILAITGADEIWYSQLHELAEHVIAIVDDYKEEVKKKIALIASSADTTEFCPSAGSNDPTGASVPG